MARTVSGGSDFTAESESLAPVHEKVSSPVGKESSFADSDYSLHSPSYGTPSETPRRSGQDEKPQDHRGNPRAQHILLSLIAPPNASGSPALRRPDSPRFGSVQIQKLHIQPHESRPKPQLQRQDVKVKKPKPIAKVADMLDDSKDNDAYSAWQEGEDKVVDVLRAHTPPAVSRAGSPSPADKAERAAEKPFSQPTSRRHSPTPSRTSSQPASREPSRPSSRPSSRPPSRPASSPKRLRRISGPPSPLPRVVKPRARTPDRVAHHLKSAEFDLGRKKKRFGIRKFPGTASKSPALFTLFHDQESGERPFSRMLQELSSEGRISPSESMESLTSALSVMGETSGSYQLRISRRTSSAPLSYARSSRVIHGEDAADSSIWLSLRREASSHHIEPIDLSTHPHHERGRQADRASPSSSLSLKLHAEVRRKRAVGSHAAMLRAEPADFDHGGHFDAAGNVQHAPTPLPVAEAYEDFYDYEHDADVLYIPDDVASPELRSDAAPHPAEHHQHHELQPRHQPESRTAHQPQQAGGLQLPEEPSSPVPTSSPFFELRMRFDDGSNSPAVPSYLLVRGDSLRASKRDLLKPSSPIASRRKLEDSTEAASAADVTAPAGAAASNSRTVEVSSRTAKSSVSSSPFGGTHASPLPSLSSASPASQPPSAHSARPAAASARPATVAGAIRPRRGQETRAPERPPIEGGELPEWFRRELLGLPVGEDYYLSRPASVCLPRRRRDVLGLQRGLMMQKSAGGMDLDAKSTPRRLPWTPPGTRAPSPGWAKQLTAGAYPMELADFE